jgi:hypothetical protein
MTSDRSVLSSKSNSAQKISPVDNSIGCSNEYSYHSIQESIFSIQKDLEKKQKKNFFFPKSFCIGKNDFSFLWW